MINERTLGKPRSKFRRAALAAKSDEWIREALLRYRNSYVALARALATWPKMLKDELDRRGIRVKCDRVAGRCLARVSTEELRRLLKINHGNTRDVAEMFDVSRNRFAMILRERGLKPQGYRKRIEVSAETLRELYWDRGMTPVKMSEIFGVSSRHLRTLMRKYNIPRRPAHRPRRSHG